MSQIINAEFTKQLDEMAKTKGQYESLNKSENIVGMIQSVSKALGTNSTAKIMETIAGAVPMVNQAVQKAYSSISKSHTFSPNTTPVCHYLDMLPATEICADQIYNTFFTEVNMEKCFGAEFTGDYGLNEFGTDTLLGTTNDIPLVTGVNAKSFKIVQERYGKGLTMTMQEFNGCNTYVNKQFLAQLKLTQSQVNTMNVTALAEIMLNPITTLTSTSVLNKLIELGKKSSDAVDRGNVIVGVSRPLFMAAIQSVDQNSGRLLLESNAFECGVRCGEFCYGGITVKLIDTHLLKDPILANTYIAIAGQKNAGIWAHTEIGNTEYCDICTIKNNSINLYNEYSYEVFAMPEYALAYKYAKIVIS